MTFVAQVDIGQSVQEAITQFAQFVPKLIGFLAILIIGYFVAKIIAKIFDKVLERVGFDRAVERGGVKKALSKSKYDASALVGKLIFYALFLFVLQLAFGVWGDNPISDIIQAVIAYLPKVLAAVLIIVVASAIAAAVREILQATLGGLSYGAFLAGAAGVAIIGIGLFAALTQLEIAEPIVIGLFYAILAVIAGSAIVAIGGGGIQPMRQQWERAMTRMEEEAPKVREEASGSKEDIKQRAEMRRQEAQPDDDRSSGRLQTGSYADTASAGTAADDLSRRDDRTVNLPDESRRGRR